MDISVIIVSFNTKEFTTNCIESIFCQTRDISFEVILVDNASTDGTADFFRNDDRITLICSDQNLGFGRGNNLGLEKATGDYIFFLNSDTILLNNALKLLFDFMQSDNRARQLGVLGCLLQNGDGQPSLSYNDFPSPASEYAYLVGKLKKTLFDKNIRCHPEDSNIDFFHVNFVTGAAMFIPAKMLRKVGAFDPQFFLYYEETDLQKRIADAGYKRAVIRGPRIIHLEGGSNEERKKFSFFMLMQSTRSLHIYMRKHFHGIEYFTFRSLMIVLRTTILFDRRFTWEQKRRFCRLILLGQVI
jgi:GT2 family glycosyltransferase